MNTLIALLAWLCLCVFLHGQARVQAALTPLLAIGITILYFSLAGVLQCLWPAGLVFYIACVALGAFAVVRKGKAAFLGMLTPGFLLFVGGCLVLLVHFAIKNPLFSEWDEFSTWGTAAKLIKQNNFLYTTATMGWQWTTTQSPGLPLLGYFAQFFGGSFAAWKVYWVYDALTLAVCSALLVPYTLKQWKQALPVALLVLLLPFFFSVFYRQVHLNKAYLTAYADIAAGLLFGGILAVYFTLRAQKETHALWPVAVLLAAFALVKENFYPVVLVAAVIIAADILFFSTPKKALPTKLLGIACALAAVLLPYFIWGKHTSWANSLNGGGQTSMDPVSAALVALQQLLGLAPKTPKFQEALNLMGPAFMYKRVSMVGGGLATCLVLLALFGVALVLQPSKKLRRRMALASILLALGFAGYQFVLLVSYGFIFKTPLLGNLVDYERYSSGYYVGAFLLAIAFLAMAGQQPQPANAPAPKRRWALPALMASTIAMVCYHTAFTAVINLEAQSGKWRVLYWLGWGVLAAAPILLGWLAKHRGGRAGRSCVLALALAVLLLFVYLVPPGLSALDFNPRAYHRQQTLQQNAQQALQHLSPGDRVFFVCQNGSGLEWFEYSYYLLPCVLDYSITGGESLLPPSTTEEERAKTLPELQEYLQQSGCNAIFVARLDDAFVATYGGLFTDGLQTFTGTPLLYLRTGQGLYSPAY